MTLRSLTLTLAGLALAAVSSAQFAPQTIAVVSLGSGAAALSNTGEQVTLLDFAKTGAAQASPLASATLPLFLSGTATSEGFLTSDGSASANLAIGGYSNSSTGAGLTGSVVNTTGAQVPRRVATYNSATGATSFTNLGSNDFSANNIRSAQVVDGQIYAAGPNPAAGSTGLDGGVLTGAFNGTTSDLAATPATTGSIRLAQFIDGTLYYSINTNIYTGAGNTGSIFGANPTGLTSGYDFVFTDANTLYVADDSVGLLKATRDATSGFFNTAVKVGTVPTIRGLAFDGTTLFATTTATTNNSLISFDLAGGNITTLASAGTNKVFRGVEVVPEPATMAGMALGLGALAARRRKKSA